MASDPTGGALPSMEYVSNSVLGPFGGLNEFDLLGFIDDNSLIATLGIEPAVVTDDCHTKLVDSNASNYVDLLPPPPQQDTYNPVTQAHTTYYTIDTELQVTNGGDIVLDETDLNSDAAPLNPILVTTAPTEEHPLTLTFTNDSHLIDSPVIIGVLSTVDEQETPLSSVEVEDIPSPSVVLTTAPNTSTTTTRGKALKRCNRKRPQVENKDDSPKTKPPRRRRPKKEKKYELPEELEDPEEEKKRLNAINAKKNRDKKKNQLQELGDKVAVVTKERDELLKEVEDLKQREQFLRKQLTSKYGIHLPNI